MAIQTNMSIVSFLKELKTRIELLSSNKITENINNSNIDKINDILSVVTKTKNKISIKDFIPVLFFILIFIVIVIAGYYFLNTVDLMSLVGAN